jgi:co-chaperonin GroES (HSP10)
MESKFQKAFLRLKSEGTELYCLRGNNLLVEVIEQEVKTASGIIIADDPKQRVGGMSEHRGVIAKVLLAGEGYYDPDTKEIEPLDINIGDIVLIPTLSISYYSTFPGLSEPTQNKIGVTLESEVKFYYRGEGALEKAKGLLNG